MRKHHKHKGSRKGSRLAIFGVVAVSTALVAVAMSDNDSRPLPLEKAVPDLKPGNHECFNRVTREKVSFNSANATLVPEHKSRVLRIDGRKDPISSRRNWTCDWEY